MSTSAILRQLSIVLLVAVSADAFAQGQPDGRRVPPKPRHRHLTTELSRLADLSGRPPQQALARARAEGLQTDDDRVAVSIRFEGAAAPVLTPLQQLGADIRNVGDGVVEAYVPLASLNGLDTLRNVLSVEPVRQPAPRALSQGVAVHNVPPWHSSMVRGAGVRVGIIDVGFVGFTALMGSDLPASVVARCYTSIGVHSSNLADCQTASPHGTAVAETLVDIAPDVQLYIANPLSRLDFQQTAQWMTSQGVRVVNFSAAFRWDGPGDGSSPYVDSPLRTVDQAVAGGATFVAAAGNEAPATWFGPFVDTNGNGRAEFAGVEDNHITLAQNALVIVQLRWNDSWSAASRDIDLHIFDGPIEIASSVDIQDGTPGQTPFEDVFFIAPRAATYAIRVDRFSGALPPWLQLQVFTSQPMRAHLGGAYSIGNPAESASPGLLAAGAAAWNNTAVIEPFSSQGPTPDGRVKPDVVGADGADTETFGLGAFFGTSQATPHVAGLAALVVQRSAGFTPAQVAAFLKASALPRGSVPNQTWGYGLAFVPDIRDTDVDGLPNFWETQFGLNPNSSSLDDGAGGDPDHDGRTNLVEFQAGTHPRGTFARYLAEGATGAVFDTRVALANPNAAPAIVQVRLLPQSGAPQVSRVVQLQPFQRYTLDADTLPELPDALFSMVVESDATIGVDRTMSWSLGIGYGSHAETGVATPAPTWYLAEGATGAAFNLFYLLQNPDPATAAQVRVRYLLENAAPLEKIYTVAPNSRFTIWVDDEQIPGVAGRPLASVNLGAVLEVVSGPRIIVERAMYLDTPGQVFAAGHDAAAVPAPATDWLLAEGATFDFFDLFVLLANPNPTPATVDVEYLQPSGVVLAKTYQVPANQRLTVWVDQEEFPAGSGNRALQNATVSTRVQVRSGPPIIVERAMWWPGPSPVTWAEAHASAGATTLGTRWVLADGEVGGPRNTETFILLANTSSTAGDVRVTLLFEDGTTAQKTFAVAATSRLTVWVRGEFAQAAGRRFGALVESVGTPSVQLVVERAMYSDAAGVTFAAGTNALGTQLPPLP